jgi:hypothetical protein
MLINNSHHRIFISTSMVTLRTQARLTPKYSEVTQTAISESIALWPADES